MEFGNQPSFWNTNIIIIIIIIIRLLKTMTSLDTREMLVFLNRSCVSFSFIVYGIMIDSVARSRSRSRSLYPFPPETTRSCGSAAPIQVYILLDSQLWKFDFHTVHNEQKFDNSQQHFLTFIEVTERSVSYIKHKI